MGQHSQRQSSRGIGNPPVWKQHIPTGIRHCLAGAAYIIGDLLAAGTTTELGT